MPKEITHWLLAETVAGRLEGSGFEPALRDNPNLLHIGAIVHDAPYYYLRGDFNARFGSLPDRLHGTVDNALELVERLLGRLLASGGTERAQLTAFLAGLVTHLFGDAVMHPLIFYLTGPYDAPDPLRQSEARRDHRLLETLVDVCMLRDYGRLRAYSLRRYLANAEMPVPDLCRTLETVWLSDEDTERFAEGLSTSLRFFGLMQALYRSRGLARLSSRLFHLSPRAAKEILALFYWPALLDQCWRVEGELSYRHPSTGEPRSATFGSLFEEAVSRSVAFCAALSPLLSAPRPPASWKLPDVDRSLEFSAPRFYSPRRFFS